MGLFNKIFGSSSSTEEKLKINWIKLTEISQLEEIKSSKKTTVIFKHSTSCGISRMVLKQFERDFNLEDGQVDMYYLDLLTYRDISNEIVNLFGVHHESPQLIVIKTGKVIANNSHSGINEMNLAELI